MKEYMCMLFEFPCENRIGQERCLAGPGCGFRKEIVYEVKEEKKKGYERLPRWYEKYYTETPKKREKEHRPWIADWESK